jgi:hypothetical protein
MKQMMPPKKQARIVIVDDHRAVREAFASQDPPLAQGLRLVSYFAG